MPAIKVGVREFREQVARFLESDVPVAVTRRGETLGVYVPTPRRQVKSADLSELKAAADRGEPDDGSRYYHYWLAALERLVTAKKLSDPAALLARKEAWADAYRRTPHGKPVELGASHHG